MVDQETILVSTAGGPVTRGGGARSTELPIQTLRENINLFLNQINLLLETTPHSAGSFHLTEFMVSAEISAGGKLVLLGSGVEAATKGALTFRFQR